MVPLYPYLAHFQPNLLAGWSDFRSELAAWLGYGFDSSQWTADEILELNRHIQEAYRWILYPQTIPGEKTPHTWSWLEQTTTLTTTADDYDYTMPADYGSFVGHFLIWGSGVSYDPVWRTNDTDILLKRQFSEMDGRPQCFALRWAAQVAGSNQRQEIILYPTPDAEYTLIYKYAVLTGPLSETNPYPLGGPRMSQLMMEAVKAIGETKKNGQRGDQWNVFVMQMQSAIALDKGTNTTRTLGMMAGSPRHNYGPRTSGAASFYFGPDASYGASLYELEA
jgi:hypothetical protein